MNTTLNFVPVPSTVNPDWPGLWQSILADEKLFKKMLHQRKRLGRGTFGAVYEIHGAAVKIGCVLPEEAQIQQWVHETYQRALPVWAYVEEMPLPRVITREVCPEHDPLDSSAKGLALCHCGETMGVLVMPLAARVGEDILAQYGKMIAPIEKALQKEFDFWWEGYSRHLLRWNGHIVMSDFGVEEKYW